MQKKIPKYWTHYVLILKSAVQNVAYNISPYECKIKSLMYRISYVKELKSAVQNVAYNIFVDLT